MRQLKNRTKAVFQHFQTGVRCRWQRGGGWGRRLLQVSSQKKHGCGFSTLSMTIEHKTLRSYLEKVPHFIWRNQKVEVIAVGTAHVSAQSLKDVETVFELYQPNAVAVEIM